MLPEPEILASLHNIFLKIFGVWHFYFNAMAFDNCRFSSAIFWRPTQVIIPISGSSTSKADEESVGI